MEAFLSGPYTAVSAASQASLPLLCGLISNSSLTETRSTSSVIKTKKSSRTSKNSFLGTTDEKSMLIWSTDSREVILTFGASAKAMRVAYKQRILESKNVLVNLNVPYVWSALKRLIWLVLCPATWTICFTLLVSAHGSCRTATALSASKKWILKTFRTSVGLLCWTKLSQTHLRLTTQAIYPSELEDRHRQTQATGSTLVRTMPIPGS